MTTMNEVQGFFAQEKIAVLGASSKGKGFGASAYNELKKLGYQLVPIHPEAATIHGDQAYRSLQEAPEEARSLLLVVPPKQTETIVEEVIKAKANPEIKSQIDFIWMQQGAESQRAIELCQEAGITVIAHECVLMFAKGSGFPHNCHRFINKIFGKLPREQAAA